MRDLADVELVRAFQAGDEVAFAEFVRRHQDRVYRMAVIWLRDTSLAEDVLQETLWRAYTGLGRFRFRASPSTWLLRVCRNVCREQNRKTERFQGADDAAHEPAESPAYDGALAQRDALRALRRHLTSLPERQREAVTLRMLEELSIAETAAVMGCRAGTVKAHLHKGLNALRRHMVAFEEPIDES